MNNVHPIFRSTLSLFAPKPVDGSRLDELLTPCEIDISVEQYAEAIYVIPDAELVKAAAAEVLEKHAREFDDAIARMLRQQRGVMA